MANSGPTLPGVGPRGFGGPTLPGVVTRGGGGTKVGTVINYGIGTTAFAALKRAKTQYEPGGSFGKGVEAGLERGRVKAMASGMQGLVSAGLAGTTMAGTLGKKYEEEVAAPTRASLEEERARALSGIELQEAGMGFQAGQAGLQRRFQASESAAQRSLQEYIADLQASTQRRSQARQFPSLYGQETGGGGMDESIPTWKDTDTPWPTAAPLFDLQKEMGLGGDYTPQTGDYMSVAGGPGGPILGKSW